MPKTRTRLKLGSRRMAGLKRRLATAPAWEKRRLRAVVLAASGKYTLDAIARRVGCSRSTVQLWLDRFRKRGMRALLERTAPPGRTSPIARPELLAQLRAALRAGELSSLEEVTDWLRAEHGIRMASKSVAYQLRKRGLASFRASPRRSAQSSSSIHREARSELKSPEERLAYDLGVQAAREYSKPTSVAYLGKRASDETLVTLVDDYLEVIYDLLERGECSLEWANRFLQAVKAELGL
jgi:transposase